LKYNGVNFSLCKTITMHTHSYTGKEMQPLCLHDTILRLICQIYFFSIFPAIWYIMAGLDVDCYLANTWLVNSKKMWYGKQKHLRCKKVVLPRKTATKRSDMRVWSRLTMQLRQKGIKPIRSSIYKCIINKSTWGIRYICT